MIVQLDTGEVQEAIVEYLRRRGVPIEDTRQIQLAIVDSKGTHLNIVGCSPVVMAYNVKFPDGPYR